MTRFTFASLGIGGPHYVFEDAPIVFTGEDIRLFAIAECPSVGDAIRIRDALQATATNTPPGADRPEATP